MIWLWLSLALVFVGFSMMALTLAKASDRHDTKLGDLEALLRLLDSTVNGDAENGLAREVRSKADGKAFTALGAEVARLRELVGVPTTTFSLVTDTSSLMGAMRGFEGFPYPWGTPDPGRDRSLISEHYKNKTMMQRLSELERHQHSRVVHPELVEKDKLDKQAAKIKAKADKIR
jgi:hypothetical protein